MRIMTFIILSIVAIGFASAHANAYVRYCPGDIACEPQSWDGVDNLADCEQRKSYCLDTIILCWGDPEHAEAIQYHDGKVIPGYERCVRRNSR